MMGSGDILGDRQAKASANLPKGSRLCVTLEEICQNVRIQRCGFIANTNPAEVALFGDLQRNDAAPGRMGDRVGKQIQNSPLHGGVVKVCVKPLLLALEVELPPGRFQKWAGTLGQAFKKMIALRPGFLHAWCAGVRQL